MKYLINISLINFNTNNAASKAIDDCTDILKQKGYKTTELTFNKSLLHIVPSLINIVVRLFVLLINIKPNSIIFTQYPIIGINRVYAIFIALAKLKKCSFACIIHDVNSLRYKKSAVAIAREAARLNAYHVIISHNISMTQWLKLNGVKTEIIDIELFDYLFKKENTFNRLAVFTNKNLEIVFAGSLGKGKFIYQLNEVAEDVSFTLYGPNLGDRPIGNQEKVTWAGSFPPDELVSKLEGAFGLIWDGDDINDCNGQFGDYIAYNNSHKVSLYLAAGLPVIIPGKAALSKFILTHNLGLTINSLYEIRSISKNIDKYKYQEMLQNINNIKNKLKVGYYFKAAIDQAELICHIS